MTLLLDRPSAEVISTPSIGPAALVEAIIRRGDSPHTKRAYVGDLDTFNGWLAGEGLLWDAVTGDDLDRYREWLASRWARATVNRRLTTVRNLYAEAHRRHLVADDPAGRLRGLRGRDDRDGGALSRSEARSLLEAIQSDLRHRPRALIARRDIALVSILLRTGIRRSEVAAIRVGDLGSSQGHRTLALTAKGNVMRTVKLPTDVARSIDEWIAARADAGQLAEIEDAVFVAVGKGGHLHTIDGLSDGAIYDIVVHRLRQAGLARLGPHALRATFVTLALEGGAPLHMVQRAAGHADPRTTERYWRRKDGLDDNAVDYVRL